MTPTNGTEPHQTCVARQRAKVAVWRWTFGAKERFPLDAHLLFVFRSTGNCTTLPGRY